MQAYQKITERLLKAIESSDQLPWHKPWSGASMPVNPISGKQFTGSNLMYLWISGLIHDYYSPIWVTCKQLDDWCKKNGKVDKDTGYGTAKIRKGESGTAVLRPISRYIEDTDTGEKKVSNTWFKVYYVFNLAQLEGVTVEDFSVKTISPEPISAAEVIFANLGAKEIQATIAAYDPISDTLMTPPHSTFESDLEYYATKAHEIVHWTGHKSRLNRPSVGERYLYSYEELVAEIGASFLLFTLGIDIPEDHMKRSADYIRTWASRLKNNPDWYPRACKDAMDAVNYITGTKITVIEEDDDEAA